jgi:HEPN domain-containing protein
MNDEARLWLSYARENCLVAELSLERELFNPSLQNAQQAVEKSLKSILVAKGASLTRTHSILKLRDDLLKVGIDVGLNDEDCDLLDSIYIPSKYPVGSALPRFDPDKTICHHCLSLAKSVVPIAEKF